MITIKDTNNLAGLLVKYRTMDHHRLLTFSVILASNNVRDLLLIVFSQFKEASTVNNHLIEMERKHLLVPIYFALILVVVVIHKVMGNAQRFHIGEIPHFIQVHAFK